MVNWFVEIKMLMSHVYEYNPDKHNKNLFVASVSINLIHYEHILDVDADITRLSAAKQPIHTDRNE